MNRCIPIFRKLIVKTNKRNRGSRHVERCDVAAYKRASDGHIFAFKDATQRLKEEVECDEWCATHTIDEGEYLLTGFQAEVINNGICQ